MANPQQLNSGFGPDYEILWRKLKERLLELQQGAAVACCTEKDNDNRSRWQGVWGAYGTVFNAMTELHDAALGKNREEE